MVVAIEHISTQISALLRASLLGMVLELVVKLLDCDGNSLKRNATKLPKCASRSAYYLCSYRSVSTRGSRATGRVTPSE